LKKEQPAPQQLVPANLKPLCQFYLGQQTGELARGVRRGEAPSPIGYHGIGRAREPIWSKTGIDNFIEPDSDTPGKQDLASLV
jgi:hypothetical protein